MMNLQLRLHMTQLMLISCFFLLFNNFNVSMDEKREFKSISGIEKQLTKCGTIWNLERLLKGYEHEHSRRHETHYFIYTCSIFLYTINEWQCCQPHCPRPARPIFQSFQHSVAALSFASHFSNMIVMLYTHMVRGNEQPKPQIIINVIYNRRYGEMTRKTTNVFLSSFSIS